MHSSRPVVLVISSALVGMVADVIVAIPHGGTVIPPAEPTVSRPLACYTTDIDGQFRNKTVKECDKDVSNCMSYYYLYKNNTEVSGKGCAKDSECKNTTKTCKTVKKKQAFIARCNIWCCQTPYCNHGSPQIHVLILILAFSLGSSIMCT